MLRTALFILAAFCPTDAYPQVDSGNVRSGPGNGPPPNSNGKQSPGDAAYVSIVEFKGGLKDAAMTTIPNGTIIQKAALAIISDQLKGAKMHLSPVGDVSNRISEEISVSHGHGTVELFGVTWKWELDPVLGDVQIANKADPVYARFRLCTRLKISTESVKSEITVIQIRSQPDRWFYIVKGKGKEQDGSKKLGEGGNPKNNAP